MNDEELQTIVNIAGDVRGIKHLEAEKSKKQADENYQAIIDLVTQILNKTAEKK